MTQQQVLEIMRRAIMVVIYASAPPLLLGLIVGVTVSIFQTVTSIQEPTLAFVPKIVAVLLAILIFGNFMMGQLESFMITLYENMKYYITISG